MGERAGWLAAVAVLAALSVSCTAGPQKAVATTPGPSPSAARLPAAEPQFEPPPLRIPAPPRPVPQGDYTSPARPPRVSGRLDVPLKRRWKYIVIHHSGTASGSAAVFDRYHREHNNWRGVGYNFVIGNGHGSPDGLVEVTFRWEQQTDGAHAGHPEYNRYGIGICVVGNCNNRPPSEKQMHALIGLVNYLQERCEIPTRHVYGHRHVRPDGTECPGKLFPWYEMLSRLRH